MAHILSPLVPRSRYLLALAAATLTVSLLQAVGAIELPFGAWFSSAAGSVFSTSSLIQSMRNVGYAGLFALMALESASLPIPSEVVLPFSGYLVYLGVMNFWAAIAVSTAASLTGALVDYYLASWLGRPFVVALLRAFGSGEGALGRAQRWFDRSGQWTVFVARFIPGLRTIISLPAGLFRMGIWPFLLMTGVGCFAWSAVLIYAGFVAGPAWAGAFESSSTLVDILSVIVALVSAGYIVYYFLLPREDYSASRPALES